MKRSVVMVSLVVLALGVAGAIWSTRSGGDEVSVDSIGDQVQSLPRGRLPVFAAPPEVASLYRYAVERGDVLGFMPCTCGCGDLGHTSNRSCYIKSEAGGRVTFTSHAAT